jgi:hypothetical protein
MNGVLRGVKRLGRCKIPNGGVDLPWYFKYKTSP